jgi:CRP/FNR family transcriptional regulator, polysaccharide utilization system transcription regulator
MNQTEHISCVQCNSRLKSIFNEAGSLNMEEPDSTKSCRHYKKGETIFDEGAYPHGLYCINSGKVKVTQTGAEGREHIVHLCKDGDVMGYRAILSGDKYSCTAVALENSSICFIPTKVFTGMVEKEPKLAFKIIHLFSDELKIAERNITDIAQKSVKERLAQGLLLLKESYGFQQDGTTLDVSMTREDIANIVGTSRETVIRLLFEIDKEGTIALEGKKIKILDQNKLLRLANISD